MKRVRGFVVPLFLAAGMGVAGVAWAVVESNPVTVANDGEPLPNATLTLTITVQEAAPAGETPAAGEETATTTETATSEGSTGGPEATSTGSQQAPAAEKPTPETTVAAKPDLVAAPRVVEEVKVTADETGRAIVMLDPEKVPEGATVDIQIESGSRVLTFQDVPVRTRAKVVALRRV